MNQHEHTPHALALIAAALVAWLAIYCALIFFFSL
jgi:hypothetical protein